MPPRLPAYQRPTDDRPDGVSPAALSIARLIDRLCRAPGRYALVVAVPTHRRAPWRVEFIRLDTFYASDVPG